MNVEDPWELSSNTSHFAIKIIRRANHSPYFAHTDQTRPGHASSFHARSCCSRGAVRLFDTLFDSIQCLNFAKKMIHSIFDSILLYPRFNSKCYSIKKKFADSIQKIIQFNSQRIIDTSRIKIAQKLSKVDQKWGFSSKMANIDSKYD